MAGKLTKDQKIARLKELKAKKIELQHKMVEYRGNNLLEFFDSPPNPGPNPKQAQVLEAFLDPQFLTFGMDGGNRLGKCLTFQTLIETPDGDVEIGKLYNEGMPFKVYAWDGCNKVIAKASPVFKKSDLHRCYRITMKDGRWVEAADYHFVLTSHGWTSVQQLFSSFHNLQESSSDTFPLVHTLNVEHSNQTQLDCLENCSVYPHQNDVPFPSEINTGVAYSPLQDGVPQHIQPWSHSDGQGHRYTNTPCKENVHPSIPYDQDRISDPFFDLLCHIFDRISLSSSPEDQLLPQQCGVGVFEPQLSPEAALRQSFASDSPAFCSPFVLGGNNIEYITPISAMQEVFDFEVEKYHNYIAGDLVHHNTTLNTIVGFSVMFGKYLWNNQSLLHLFPHKKARKVRYIGQGWHDHIEKVVIPELQKWWPKNRAVETHGNGIIRDTFWKDVQTGGSLEVMSNNQDPKEHEGWSGDLIIYDEPCRREIYVANARGLVDRKGREMFAATLLAEPWIDKEIKKKMGADGKPDKTVFWVSGTSYDNVGYGITKEGVDQLVNKLSEAEKQARIYGIPQYMQGLIYPQFTRKDHLFPWFKIPLSWMVDVSIDVHPRERQAVLFVATDPRNDRYICDEIWEYGDGTWVGEEIVRRMNLNSYRINRIVIDPLSKGDSNNAETTFQKVANVLGRYGLCLETASKDKDTGILEVKKHLRGPNNKPSIFLLDNCMRTLSEIEGYMWNKETNKPVDKDDHMMENLYRICNLNTQYMEPEEEVHNYRSRGYSPDLGRNLTTGY